MPTATPDGMPPGVEIRLLDLDCELDRLTACMVELQELERGLDPRMPPGEEIARPYLELMAKRCREYSGLVMAAESGAAVIGFVAVWGRVPSTEPDDDPREYAYVSDLVVLERHRHRGLGRRLLAMAEEYARSLGPRPLRLSVKAGNSTARALYEKNGFTETESVLQKELQ